MVIANYLNENLNNFIGIYPEIILIYSILFILTFSVIYDYYTNYKLILHNNVFILSILSLIFFILLLVNSFGIDFIIFQSLLISDIYTNNIKIIISVFTLLIIFTSLNYLKKEIINNYEYFILVLLAILGLFFLVSSYDLISMYLSIELQALSFYILATFKQYTNFSTEAGIKYFILGAFSSGLLLFGCSILYGFTGLTDFYSLEIYFQNNLLPADLLKSILIGLLFILIGFLFKMAAAPFHMWSPDVYEGAPTIITMFFAIIPKIALLSFLFKFIIKVLSFNIIYIDRLFFFCSFLSLIWGTFAALFQTKFKRLLAYSAVSHVGFLLIGLSIMSIDGFYSTLFYIIVYMVLSFTIFSLLINLRKWNNNLKLKKVNEIILLFKSHPTIVAIFVLTLFSVAGIPPLIGFYSKLYIFISGIKADFLIIILIAAIISVISSFYYLRLIKLMVFKKYTYFIFLQNISYSNALLISLMFFFNFFFLFSPMSLILVLHNLILGLFI